MSVWALLWGRLVKMLPLTWLAQLSVSSSPWKKQPIFLLAVITHVSGLVCFALFEYKDFSTSSVIMGLAALSYFWAGPQTSYIALGKQLRIDPFLLPFRDQSYVWAQWSSPWTSENNLKQFCWLIISPFCLKKYLFFFVCFSIVWKGCWERNICLSWMLRVRLVHLCELALWGQEWSFMHFHQHVWSTKPLQWDLPTATLSARGLPTGPLRLTAQEYLCLKITGSKVLKELAVFAMPRSGDFLCQFKVSLGNELALIQPTGASTGSLTPPALLTAASGTKSQQTVRSQKPRAFFWEKKTYERLPMMQGDISNPGWHVFLVPNT